MAATESETSWWGATTWFSAAGVAEPAARPDVTAPSNHVVPAPPAGLVVGGARSQSRFGGKTAIPMGTCAPGSVRSRSATLHSLPAASASLDTAVSGQVAPGQTADGSTPACAYGGALRGEEGPHISRWQWCEQAGWVLRDQQPLLGAGTQAAAASSDKHTLAARRWGDGRDALAAAAVARCAPAKRPRLLASTLTGDPSDAGFEAVGGLLRQKEALMAALALPLLHPRLFSALGASPARGVLLHGPPGSGKTHLVRALAAQARLPLVVLNGGECVGEGAERVLARAFTAAKSQAPCILLFDELDALAPCRRSTTSEHERAATARLLAAVDELRGARCRVALVGTTSRRQAVDGALRRAGRLDSEVALGALQAGERLAVLQCCSRHMPLHSDVQLQPIATRLRGFVAADVAAVCAEAALVCAVEAVRVAEAEGRLEAVQGQAFLAGLAVRAAHFEAAEARLGPAVLRGLAPEVPDTRFEDIGGLQEVKATLREMIELPLCHGKRLAAYGLPPPRGALLYGPPGCGKTLLARAAAARCGANFLAVSGPELLQKWLGESEAAVRAVFEAARQASPCLIFFDEVDSIAGRRGGAGGAAGEATAARVLNQLLVEMDGLAGRGEVFILAATNRPQALDPALLRPGRLDHLLQVPLPDPPARLAILAASLRRCPLAADVDLAGLAGEATEGMSGADLSEVARRAGTAAIRELVAAEQAWAAAHGQAGSSSGGGAGAAPPAMLPLRHRHLADALAGMRRSVSAGEAAHHAGIEQLLQQGSLPGEEQGRPAGTDSQRQQAGEQQRLLRQVVQQAVGGTVERRLSSLQARVQQLEEALRNGGMAVPEPAPTPAAV
ncbi:hypothetical protein D9Q98_001594 [Chlorella vulgaris]|uniref:AAA+ ATPase domain-containing protein n=1 Tax=Chlorella vulgaris TaxID=3077 RepID=A0A9D4TUS4_CHLVU|nr:hypothetical protein D9Q98_001594 [Chlorella vulgaris]